MSKKLLHFVRSHYNTSHSVFTHNSTHARFHFSLLPLMTKMLVITATNPYQPGGRNVDHLSLTAHDKRVVFINSYAA